MKEALIQLYRRIRFLLFKLRPSPDLEKEFIDIYDQCQPFTMTSAERMYALYQAVQYVTRNNIPGDVVECGVYKGGSMMLCAHTLKALNDTSRNLYLYDTFEGMSEPTDRDKNISGDPAMQQWQSERAGAINKWCYAGLDEVKKNMAATAYPPERMHFIQGKVEDTLPKKTPDTIALLRLDTDWFESTYQELTHLYPKLSKNGVIIIDDYGHWKGAREAVDKYFGEHHIKIFLNRIDYTGRIGIKS